MSKELDEILRIIDEGMALVEMPEPSHIYDHYGWVADEYEIINLTKEGNKK